MTGQVRGAERRPPLPGYVWSGIAAAAIAVGATVFSWAFDPGPNQKYPDFIVGYPAWAGVGKGADLWSIPAALAGAFVAALLLYRVAQALRDRGVEGEGAARSFASQLLLGATPAAIALGSLFYRFGTEGALFHTSTAAVTLMALTVGLGLRRGAVDPRSAAFAVLGVALIALLPVEWALVRDRLLNGAGGPGYGVSREVFAVFAVGAVVVLGTSAIAPDRLGALAKLVLAVGSAGLPVLFLLLWRGRFALPSGEVFRPSSSAALGAVVAGLAVLAWGDLWRRISRGRLNAADPAAVLSPWALFALVVALRYAPTVAPVVPSDDFHFGERLLGWWTALRFHALPFVDYVPLHGVLEDDLAGYVSTLFFDGTAATIGESDRLVYVALALVVYMAMWRVTGSLVLALGAALTLGGRLAWFLLTPVFCLAADESLAKRPERWLALWIVAAPVVVLAVPAQGVLAIASTAPLAAVAAFRWWRSHEVRLRSWPAAALVVLAIIAVGTPVGRMLVGAIRYLAEFGPVNQVAYAIPWQASLRPEAHPTLAAELVRMSWVAIPALAAALIAFYPRDESRRPRVVATALPPLLFAVALVPYMMGRIDPIEISRPGVVAVFGWSVLVPLMIWAALRERAIPALALTSALCAGMLGANPGLVPLLQASGAAYLPGDPKLAAEAGLTTMGAGLTDDAHRLRVRRLKATLDELLPPGRTYLDLTGHSADYFYTGRPPAMRIPAPYNVVPFPEQRRAVESLSREPPAVALLSMADSPNYDIDGGSLSLRVPLLYRFVMDTYEPYERGGFLLGRLRDASSTGAPRPEAELALFDRVYATRNLQWIPVAWGRSFDTLTREMDPVAVALDQSPRALHDLAPEGDSLRIAGADPYLSLDVSDRAIVPAQAGLLTFDFECMKPREMPRLQIFFWGEGQEGPAERASLYLNAANGRLIVPLDAYPRYLGLARLRGLRVDLDNPGACAAIAIRDVAIQQRRSVRDFATARAASRPR